MWTIIIIIIDTRHVVHNSADAIGKSADGSVNWYTGVTRDGRQWLHLCLRDIKVFKRRYALTMCVNVSHTNKQTFHCGRRKSKMIYSREKDEIAVLFLDSFRHKRIWR